MKNTKLPFTKEQIEEICKTHPTPFHIYDESAIIKNIRDLKAAFSWADFKEYFAVKAAPNPFLMKILHKEGVGADCSSLAELLLSEKCGVVGDEIMFTSNDTPADEFAKANELKAIINFDDISHIKYFEENVGKLPDLVCFRYNPGKLKKGNAIIGHPEDAKYGFTKEQLFEGYRYCKERGVKSFGLHTMVASNELNPEYFVETAKILFELVAEISSEIGITFQFVNLGGGIGIPYKPEDSAVDLNFIGDGVKKLYNELIESAGLHPLKIYLECGRMVTGPYGYLVSRARHIKKTYKNYLGLDATMANLMRPALYGSYHHITVLGKEDAPKTEIYDVTGSLCENNDKFAIARELPTVSPGEIVVIHDAGAHGHAMGFNYNGKLRSAELLLRESGEIIQIRREERVEDLFATLDLNQLEDFQ